jgi:hypothetical protein
VLPTQRDRWAISVWAYADPSTAIIPGPALAQPLIRSAANVSAAQQTSAASAQSNLSELLLTLRCGPDRGPPPLTAWRGAEWSQEARTATIFVSIAAYRDSELRHTVRSLLSTALNCSRVYIAVVNQLGPGDEQCTLTASDIGQTYYEQHVRTLTLAHSEARGPLFARSLAAGLYRGERYVLQIDSHMRFRQHWDAYLVDTLEAARTLENCPRPVLTTYPQGYLLPDAVPADTRPTILVLRCQCPFSHHVSHLPNLSVWQMPSYFDAAGFLRQDGKVLVAPTAPLRYLRSPLWAAGFSFSDACVLLEVPASPLLSHLFFGEEQSTAARYRGLLSIYGCSHVTVGFNFLQAVHARLRLLRPGGDGAVPPLQPRPPPHPSAGRHWHYRFCRRLARGKV